MKSFEFERKRIGSGWNPTRLILGKKLDDRTIRKYEKLGYYSPEYRAARRERWKKKQTKREGNFVYDQGKMIYSPI